MTAVNPCQVPQDLHIHTTFSTGDGAVVPEQTVDLIARVRHARVIGISDHVEYVWRDKFEAYARAVREHSFHLGVEVTEPHMIPDALSLDVEYYVVHCKDEAESYAGVEKLMATGKPVIVAHPLIMNTDLTRIPPTCCVELNNRYIWRSDWRTRLAPFVSRFRFVINSDAHQPLWLNQNVARYVARELGITETLLFG